MPYKTGTVAGFSGANGLLAELVNWVTGTPATRGLDWTLEMDSNTKTNTGLIEPFTSECRQVVLSNTGISGEESVVVGIREWKYTAGAVYGWDLNCYPLWVDGQLWNNNSSWHGQTTYDATYNHFSTYPNMPLMNAEMTYWFFSNAQRIIVVVRTSTIYQCCYLGYGYRLGTPSEYPCPVMALGCSVGNLPHSDQSATHRWFLNPPAFFLNTPAGECRTPLWIPGGTYWSYTLNAGPVVGTTGKFMSPCYAVISSLGTLFTFDGVRHVVDTDLQAEDILSMDKEKWFVTQNNHRITMYDFMAINTEMAATTTTAA